MFSRLFKPDVEKLARKRDVAGLRAAFEHEDASVRVRALRALVVLEPEGLAELLAAAIEDEDTEVRDAAVSLGGRVLAAEDPLSVELVAPAVVEPPVAAPPPPAPPPEPPPPPPDPPDADALRLGLLSPDPARRAASAEALGALAHPDAEPGLITALSDEDPLVRQAAAGALDALPRTRATIFALVDALSDEDLGVRERAARSLGRLGDPTAVGPLLDLLERGSPAAARALGEIGDPRALPPLLDALGQPELVVAAAEALRRLGEPAALDALDAAAAGEGPGAEAARDAALRIRSRKAR